MSMQFQIPLADRCQTGKFIVTGFGFAVVGVWFDGLSLSLKIFILKQFQIKTYGRVSRKWKELTPTFHPNSPTVIFLFISHIWYITISLYRYHYIFSSPLVGS